MVSNGVDMGTELMGPNISNALGHGEDIGFVKLHDHILHLNGADWRYHQQKLPQLMNDSIPKMELYIKNRIENLSENTLAFGAKDPRALFFLDAWHTACEQNIKFILVFRDWQFAVSSLLKRHSRSLLQFNQPMTQRSIDLNFWHYPDLAAQMWLISVERMLACAKAYPAQTLLFEQSAMVEKNEQICEAAVIKGILFSALKCDVFQPDLMQKNIPSSMLDMISPSLKQKCDAMLSKLREVADVASPHKIEKRPAPQLVSDVMDEHLLVAVQDKQEKNILQLPSNGNRKITFKGESIEDSIATLKTMHTDILNKVDWDALLAYPDVSANNSIELFYLAVKAKIHYASEIFILRAIQKRDLYWQWVHLGDHYFRLKHFTSAAQCYAKANDSQPEHAGIIAKLADIATVEERYKDSHELLQKARSLDPDHSAIRDAQVRLERAIKVNSQHNNVNDEAHSTKLVTDYTLVSNAMAASGDFGKKLEHFMVETNFWLRDNQSWLQKGVEHLTQSAQRCLLDYLFTHLKQYWPIESLYSAFIKSEEITWDRFLSNGVNRSILGDYVMSDVKIGVHIHVSYLHLLPEILALMKALPRNTQIIITCPSSLEQRLKSIAMLPSTWLIMPVANRGSDIAPWLLTAAPAFINCDMVLKLHTKGTLSSNPAGWRSQLLWSVIGNKANVVSIIERFKQDSTQGVLLPEYHPKIAPNINWGENYALASNVAANIGLSDLPVEVDKFPAGSMFWYRPEALLQLTEYPWRLDDFPEENGEIDGTIMHAIERLISTTAIHGSYKIAFIDRYPKTD
jgi:tetratricopeptide (TPR) repeat protein